MDHAPEGEAGPARIRSARLQEPAPLLAGQHSGHERPPLDPEAARWRDRRPRLREREEPADLAEPAGAGRAVVSDSRPRRARAACRSARVITGSSGGRWTARNRSRACSSRASAQYR